MSTETSDKNVANVDEKAVNDDIKLIKNLMEDNKIEIKNVSIGREFRLLRTLENILSEREQDKKKIKELEIEKSKLKEYCKELIKEKQELTTVLLDSIPKQKVEEVVKEAIEIIDSELFKVIMGDVTKVTRLRYLLEKELLEE